MNADKERDGGEDGGGADKDKSGGQVDQEQPGGGGPVDEKSKSSENDSKDEEAAEAKQEKMEEGDKEGDKGAEKAPNDEEDAGDRTNQDVSSQTSVREPVDQQFLRLLQQDDEIFILNQPILDQNIFHGCDLSFY